MINIKDNMGHKEFKEKRVLRTTLEITGLDDIGQGLRPETIEVMHRRH